MTLLVGPVDSLSRHKKKCEGLTLEAEVFDKTGVFIIRKMFIESYITSYRNYLTNNLNIGIATRNKFNPVSIETSDPFARSIVHEPKLVEELKKILGLDICLYNFRIVMKDEINDAAVFLHNDIGYHLGQTTRVSVFVAVSDAGAGNGGMEFFLGTHNFGLLGDAGELNIEVLGENWPTITPSLVAGDVVIMHSALWHRSGPNLEKRLRILADIHYQPASDPTGIELISGKWMTDYRIPREVVPRLFKRSRVSRLLELEEKLARAKEE